MSPGPLARRGERDFRATGSPSEPLLMTRRWRPRLPRTLRVVELAGIEPATSALQRRRSPS